MQVIKSCMGETVRCCLHKKYVHCINYSTAYIVDYKTPDSEWWLQYMQYHCVYNLSKLINQTSNLDLTSSA